MSYLHLNALQRAGLIRAKIQHIVKWPRLSSLIKLAKLGSDPRQSYPKLSDHLARDIGLDPADREWGSIELPSQTTHHPRG
ncbi:hypothetical protein [Sulfitobacter sp. MF3-043]|uniref:hypothetical protein n=1 Tax=Sulfitobacter sediminivivens TaxID=3252902 RepID=UPI0036D8FF24